MAPYNREICGDYPEILQEDLTKPQRFEVTYRDGRAWNRITMRTTRCVFEPTGEDLAWDPEAFLARFLAGDDMPQLGIEPRPDTQLGLLGQLSAAVLLRVRLEHLVGGP